MITISGPIPNQLASPAPAPVAMPKLLRAYWVGVATLVLAVALTAHPQYIESVIGAAIIGAAALLPLGIWVNRKAKGLPLFPIFALTHLWTFGLPLLYEHPIVSLFPPGNQIYAAISVTGFLLIGTTVWYLIARRDPKPIKRVFAIRSDRADTLFLALLGSGVCFDLLFNSGAIGLAPGLAPIIRAVVLALEGIAGSHAKT